MIGDPLMQGGKRLVGGFWEGYHYEYTASYYTGQYLVFFGILLAGMGLIGAIAVWIGQYLNNRKKASYLPPPPPLISAPVQKYCRYCGTENKNDAFYCEKCGRQIS
jgi:hypothetical protein